MDNSENYPAVEWSKNEHEQNEAWMAVHCRDNLIPSSDYR